MLRNFYLEGDIITNMDFFGQKANPLKKGNLPYETNIQNPSLRFLWGFLAKNRQHFSNYFFFKSNSKTLVKYEKSGFDQLGSVNLEKKINQYYFHIRPK